MSVQELRTPSVGYPAMGCRVSGRKEGLALRGVFILFLIPLGLYVLWKKRKK